MIEELRYCIKFIVVKIKPSIHDAVAKKQKDVYDQNIKLINNFIDKKQASDEFEKWFKVNYLKRNTFKDK